MPRYTCACDVAGIWIIMRSSQLQFNRGVPSSLPSKEEQNSQYQGLLIPSPYVRVAELGEDSSPGQLTALWLKSASLPRVEANDLPCLEKSKSLGISFDTPLGWRESGKRHAGSRSSSKKG